MENLVINSMDNYFCGKNVLVTGATGLVGSHLTEKLVAQGAKVVISCRSVNPRSYFASKNLETKVISAFGDIKDYDRVFDIVSRYEIDYIFHIAAQAIVPTAFINPKEALEVNIMGTVNVLEAARHCPRVKGVVVASSDKAYGKNCLNATEDWPMAGDHPYDTSKSCADLIARAYAKTYNLSVAVSRFGNIFGPGDPNFNRIIPGIIKTILFDEILEIRSDGTFVRDYVYVKDVVDGYILLMENIDRLKGEAFNFSSGYNFSVLDLIQKISLITGKTFRYKISNDQVNEIVSQSLDYTKARNILGWQTKRTFEEGVLETFDWYQQYFKSEQAVEAPKQSLDKPSSASCRACGSPLTKFFSLGQMPLVNSFLKKEELIGEEKFDLSVGFCSKCYLAQLTETVPPEKLFTDYIYFSSTSKLFLEHCRDLANSLSDKLKLNSESLVLEIASNDGAQLQAFKNLGIKILGVDPAKNIAEVANQKGITTIPEFFNWQFAKKLKTEKGVQADLIFGANVLAHVPEIVDFVRGVKEILKPGGTAVFEFPYLKGLMDNKFDTIYHEHVFYYSLIALINLFKTADLEIYDVEQTSMQGGSLLISISQTGNFPISYRVKNLIVQELADGFDKLATYQKINDNVSCLKNDVLDLLTKIKAEGKKIAAYSAPAKGNILLNYFGIDNNYLDFIVDKAPAKQGLYTPGTHLLVEPLAKIDEVKPDYLLVLCWNIADEVINMPELVAFRQRGGKFIVPVPTVKVV